uniref:SRCR domain-containing protein n=1 Tax=Branchiostoma floridae TaxID=7739 RepID=C3Y515_BRAFL|eukprot:XP_002608538.1 hypothetical protein BRAFLDRAFT_92363 [Branchiostoma floridae]
MRLVGGATEYEGRVEIQNSDGTGQWGTICDDDFDLNDARVVCRQLGYGFPLQYTSGVFGEGSGSIWLDDVQCEGDEETLLDCPSNDWGEHDCGHYEDVGVICSMEVRLVGGSSANEGRVEIRIGNGEWGTICDDSFDINAANVVCRQLGYGNAASYEGWAYFGQGTGSIWLDDVECDGDEETLLDCSSGVVSADLTLPGEVFSEDLNDRNSPRYRMLAGTLESEVSKAFEDISTFRQATVKSFR